TTPVPSHMFDVVAGTRMQNPSPLVERFVNSYEVLVADVSLAFSPIGSNREMSSHGPLARRHPMPTPIAPRIILAQNTRLELHTLARAHTTPQSLALRARIVLRCAAVAQPTNLHIGRELGCSNLTVGKWRRRYSHLGLAGLQDARRPRRPETLSSPTP